MRYWTESGTENNWLLCERKGISQKNVLIEEFGKDYATYFSINDLKKQLVIAEIKLNKSKISINRLKQKATQLLKRYLSYGIEYLALALDDAADYL